jgi:hypothetical protein
LYRKAVDGIYFSGPTYFSSVIKAMLEYMKYKIDSKMYHVLLILTDGEIHDMQYTKDLIVECSYYPLSVVIVGIGDADFSKMIELDGDEVIVRNTKGEYAARDIV